jgi:hypothetical protein
MPIAVEHIRRMRGGAQSQLMRCADGAFYVVKFQNNPQGSRVLVNELLATRLAALLGIATAPPEIVQVSSAIIDNTDELVIQLGRGRTKYAPGKQFGSRYPGASPAECSVFDFLPDEDLQRVANLGDFCGMLVFDKWTCNTNGRQAIFFRRSASEQYQTQMIDNGFCFNACEWNFPDAPLRGLYNRHRVYENVRGIDAFEPWLSRVEMRMTDDVMGEIADEIPPEWYNFDRDAMASLLERLARRRKLVRELIFSAWKSSAQPFPNWT